MIASVLSELQWPVGFQATMKNVIGYEETRNTRVLDSMNEDTKPTFQDLVRELENVPTRKLFELLSDLADSDQIPDVKHLGFEVLGAAISTRLKQEPCSCGGTVDLQLIALHNCACGIVKPHLHCVECGCTTEISK